MSARPGEWDLLDHDSDPVPGDPDAVNAAAGHFSDIAATIHDIANRLKSIGAGESLKGQYADQLRQTATDVSSDLVKVSGRYDAAASAVRTYQPHLQASRSESAGALADAVQANQDLGRANGMADPSANRPADAPPLTADETAQVSARTTAVNNANDALAAAKARLTRTVDDLNGAGQALASTVRGSFDDGLTDSLGDKIKNFFTKFFKILTEVFQWIGVVLAAIAIIIPGVGALALIGAVVAVGTLVSAVAEKALGGGSWLDVGLAIGGVVLLGAGGLLAKGLQMIGDNLRSFVNTTIGAGRTAMRADADDQMAVEMADYLDGGDHDPAQILADRNNRIAQANEFGADHVDGGEQLPNRSEWWQVNNDANQAAGRQGFLQSSWNTLKNDNIYAMIKNKGVGTYLKNFAGVDGVEALSKYSKWTSGIAGAPQGLTQVGAWTYYGMAGSLRLGGYATFGLGLAAEPLPGTNVQGAL